MELPSLQKSFNIVTSEKDTYPTTPQLNPFLSAVSLGVFSDYNKLTSRV